MSSGTFEDCFFELKMVDEIEDWCLNPVIVENYFEKVLFSKCSFIVSGKIKGTSSFDIGPGDVSFDGCNFFYPKDAPLVIGDSREAKFNCCRFNIEYEGVLQNTSNCSFEPNATRDEFEIGGSLRLDCEG